MACWGGSRQGAAKKKTITNKAEKHLYYKAEDFRKPPLSPD